MEMSCRMISSLHPGAALIGKFVIVLLLSVIIGIVAAFPWESHFFGVLGSFLFSFFLPGIIFVAFIGGGMHDLAEVDVVLGVLVQMVVMWGALSLVIRSSRRTEK